jgi:AraC-like DNA-binding protein
MDTLKAKVLRLPRLFLAWTSIDAIALESGFSSRTTFYRAFKKEKGMIPSDYFSKN